MPIRQVAQRPIDLRESLTRRRSITVREIIAAFPKHYQDRDRPYRTAARNVQNYMQTLMAFEDPTTLTRERSGANVR